MDTSWHLYLMAFFYIAAGVNHYCHPKLYFKLIPHFLPYKYAINELVGGLEIILGVYLFFPSFTGIAAWFIIVLLLALFPANIYMCFSDKIQLPIPKWLFFVRLPFQFVLIFWAYQYTVPLF